MTELTSGLGIIGAITGALTLIAAGFAALYAKRAANTAISLFNLERTPFLSVEAIDGTQYRWSNSRGKWKLRKSGSKSPLYLNIRNSGRSVAFVNGIYRRWVSIVDDEAESAEALCRDSCYYKDLNFPVGNEGFTIASESERAEYDPDKRSILLIGYIDFTDFFGERRYRRDLPSPLLRGDLNAASFLPLTRARTNTGIIAKCGIKSRFCCSSGSLSRPA